MEEKHGVDFIFYFFVYLKLFLIYCMDVAFFKLFLFVYYCNIVYKKLVFQKMRNPNGLSNSEDIEKECKYFLPC